MHLYSLLEFPGSGDNSERDLQVIPGRSRSTPASPRGSSDAIVSLRVKRRHRDVVTAVVATQCIGGDIFRPRIAIEVAIGILRIVRKAKTESD